MFDYLRLYIYPGVQVQTANLNQLTPKQHADFCDYLSNYMNSLQSERSAVGSSALLIILMLSFIL